MTLFFVTNMLVKKELFSYLTLCNAATFTNIKQFKQAIFQLLTRKRKKTIPTNNNF